MKYQDEVIKGIVGEISSGLVCYLDRTTGEYESFPSESDMDFFDDEEHPWEEAIEKVRNNRDNYIEIEPMPSFEGYAVMEAFAEQVPDEGFRQRLQQALNRRKPFRNFKDLIDASDYRQDWFAFERQKYEEYVKEIISEAEDDF